MKIPATILAVMAAAAIALSGGKAQAQATINGIYPDGAYQFQPSPTLSFTAGSPAGIDPTNITVQLTVTSLQTGQSFIKSLTSTHGLTIGGTSTSRSVSAVLNSNTIYSAVIHVVDANSSSANASVSFDTVSGYTWEAEDYDYTTISNGVSGLFIDNPQTNLYAGLDSTAGVDTSHNGAGGHDYRPNTGSSGLCTEGAGDKARVQYSTGLHDYDLGFNNGGDFGNYTRHYPAGTYNIYLRGSGGNGPRTDCASMTVTAGTAAISGPGGGPFQFSVAGLGWQTYTFCPLKDSAGNLAEIVTDGSASQLRVTIDQGNCNENFYLLVPVDTNVVVSTAAITNPYPDGAALYQSTNVFTFTASAPDGLSPSDISVAMTATNLYGHGYVTNLTSGSGLTITGSSTNWTVSAALTSNTVYSVFIQVNDAHGVPTSFAVAFDTIIPAYSFEAEDFDYGSGQYIDNPQTNAYNGFDGVAEVDFHATQHGGSYNRVGLTTEGANDKTRAPYAGTGFGDYDVGFNDGGNWGNYTRNYPAGVYNIFVRASNGGGNGSTDSGSISLVTGGVGTSSQTLVQLGKFGVPVTGGWQTYAWVPVKDSSGNLAQFSGGSLETLRMTIDGGNCNENFFLLMPADPSLLLQPFVDNFQPNGSAMFGPTTVMSFLVHSQPGTATGNIGLKLNGVTVSALTFSGSPNLRTVTAAVKTNTFYTAIVTVTDANGTVTSTNTFSTFSSANYQWEGEDYDYTSDGINGQFFDNQVNAYAGLGGASGIDMFESDVNGPGRGNVYRAANGSDFPDENCGDQARDQFAGQQDHNLGSFGGGSWVNYTRTYPAGTYFVVGRFAEGAGPSQATLSLLTNGVSTNMLGTFTIPNLGWGTWQWQQMTDNSGNPTRVTLDGTQQILRLDGNSGNEVNVNFLMLVATAPTPRLTATVSGGSITISFPTQTGYSYQLQYKNNLTDASWTSLGGSISGTGAVRSGTDSAAGGHRFYHVQVQ